MRRGTLVVATLSVVVGVGLTACSRSSGAGAGTSSGGPAAKGAAANIGGSTTGGFAPRALRPREPGVGPPVSRPDAAYVAHLVEPQQIRTAQITVSVKGARNVAQQADAADAVAAQFGGEVTVDDRVSGRHATATLVLRVPPAALVSTLHALSRLGVEKSRHISTIDVTQQVADVASRVISARAAIAQLRDLYRRATKVRDVIAVETQLASREADLESLQARQRALANQTTLATITLRLVTAPKSKPKPAPATHYSGFVGGLERGWHAFSTAVAWLALAFGALLPFLVVALAIALAAWQLRRRLRPSR